MVHLPLPDTAAPPPASPEAAFDQGVELMQRGERQAAMIAFGEALAGDPSLAEAHINLGYLLEAEGDTVGAEKAYRQGLALDCGLKPAYLNLSALLADQGRLDEAEAVCRTLLQRDPENAGAWSNLGVIKLTAQADGQAEACLRQAMALAPDYWKAPFNLAYVLLRQGRWSEGWSHLESRPWYEAVGHALPFPRWRGGSPAGQRILLVPEAGHGDMIQFARYGAWLKAAGAIRVGCLCHPALARLFQRLEGLDEAYSLTDGLPDADWDAWVPPLSLPGCHGTTLAHLPNRVPYLSAAPEAIAHWHAPLAGLAGPRVGLVWKGNPRFENDRARTLPSLDTLAPLAAVPGIHWVSLQKGAGEEEAITHPPFPLFTCAESLTDFADTAALIAHLDLVITVDTAVAHLTGALGKPCWLLLPAFRPDWRWLKSGDESPWYPGVMRLFRQSPGEDWGRVIARVATALAEWLRQPRPPRA